MPGIEPHMAFLQVSIMAKQKPRPTDCPVGDLRPVQAECPECGHQEFEPSRGRFGPIWRCGNRPACKFWLGSKPTGETCPYVVNGKPCRAPMVEGTKTIPDRCSRKECPNRNPHKLSS